MNIAVIWEARFGSTNEQSGLEVTRKIWQDMLHLADCLDYTIVRDQEEQGHILVISQWSSSEIANAAKNRYAAHPNAVIANQLALEAPRQWVGLPENTPVAGREAA